MYIHHVVIPLTVWPIYKEPNPDFAWRREPKRNFDALTTGSSK